MMVSHEIHVRPEERPNTAFIRHKGLFLFNLMPFALCNAPAYFAQLMDGIFSDQIGKELTVNHQDILMYRQRHSEMLLILYRTLAQLIEVGLKCKHRKCQLLPD